MDLLFPADENIRETCGMAAPLGGAGIMEMIVRRWVGITRLLCFSAAVAVATVLPRSVKGNDPLAVVPAIRVVGCEEKGQSHKRGVCANYLDPADFRALGPGVSWWYDWGTDPGNIATPADSHIRFVPMVWGDHPDALAGLERYLAAGHKPDFVLADNEPNLRNQSFIIPSQAAAFHLKVKAITDKYGGIPIVGPQMAIASSPQDSVVAEDPIEKKQVTYTFMVPYLKAFFACVDGDTVHAIAIHPYDGIDGLRALVELTHRTFNKPLWVTEFADANARDENSEREYLVKATDFLERSAYVEGYAWFKERASGALSKVSRLGNQPGQLTPLGQAYVSLPVHDSDLYYRLPGRLQAENYVALDAADIWLTGDVDGFAHMASDAAGAWLDYNVQVDQAGPYQLQLRVIGKAGAINVLSGNTVIASARLQEALTTWTTLSVAASLGAGPQTLRLQFESPGQGINWIAFGKL